MEVRQGTGQAIDKERMMQIIAKTQRRMRYSNKFVIALRSNEKCQFENLLKNLKYIHN